MEKPMNEQTLQRIQEEIRARVFEKYAKEQGVKTQLTEIEATIEALGEVTNIPIDEIERIAEQVTREISEEQAPPDPQPDLHTKQAVQPTPSRTPMRSIDELDRKLIRQKRSFYPHLVAFVAVNLIFFFLNASSRGFPWFIIPFLGWSIGLISHYLKSVHFPSQDLKAIRKTLSYEIDSILHENVPGYSHDRDRIYSGAYRMLVSSCSFDEMRDFIAYSSKTITNETASQTAMLLMNLRESVISDDAYDDHHEMPRPFEHKRRRRRR